MTAPRRTLTLRPSDCNLPYTFATGAISCPRSLPETLAATSPNRSSRPRKCQPPTRPWSRDSLVDANLCGHDSHGVMRVPQYIDFLRKGTYKPGVALTMLNETPAVLTADANWGLGQVQTYRLLDQLIPKAKSPRRRGRHSEELRPCRPTGRVCRVRGEGEDGALRGRELARLGPARRAAGRDRGPHQHQSRSA